jgi:hypothetical protein
MDCMPDGCLVGDGRCPVLGEVPWPGPVPEQDGRAERSTMGDARERAIEAGSEAMATFKGGWDRRAIAVTVLDAVERIILDDAFRAWRAVDEQVYADYQVGVRRTVVADLRAKVEALPKVTASEGIGPWNVGYRAAVDDLLSLLDDGAIDDAT